MKNKQPISICVLFLTLLLYSPLSAQIIPYNSEKIEENYANEIALRRAKEEASFRKKETTLLSADYFDRFTGLNYFDANLKYRIVGKLTKLSKSVTMELDMTNGKPYGFMHYGKVNFYLEGEAIELMVFGFPSRNGPRSIFVPFTDMTTGEECFGGGRFVIINIPQGDQVVIDFNQAINPICVYDPDHICPIPPRTNRIQQKILAGAKMYYDPEDNGAGN